MARINIEDSLFKDQRFIDLVIALKDYETALGALARCWIVAQGYWKYSDNGIPKTEWVKQKLKNELITSGLAEDRGEFVFVVGSEKHFAWIRQRVEAGEAGGIESGKARVETKRKKSKRKEANASKRKQTEPSFSSSSSSSLSNSNSEVYSVGESAVALPAEIKNPIGYFIAVYLKAYQARYGKEARPDLSGQVQGRLKAYLKGTPIERACAMIQTYCEMNDTWFLTKGHDFETFMQNLTKVGLKLDTGKAITRTEVNEVDKRQTTFNVFDKLIREEQEKSS